MFRRLLVPVDLSGRSHEAVELARRLASPGEAEVSLLHVIETIEGADEGGLESFYSRLEERAREVLDGLASEIGADGLRVRRDIVYGRRPREIVAFAERNHHDIIVMGSHRIDLEQPSGDWPTLSYQVAILAQCPVLLVK